jgi:PRTRC genetic system protein B
VAVRGSTPLAEIAIYEDVVVMTRRSGRHWRSHPVSPDAIAQTLAQLPLGSGLLPAGTLATGRVGGQMFLVTYVPAAVRELRTEQRAYTIPLPPLVWVGCGQDYRLFALGSAEYPGRESLTLMAAPFPNTYGDGRICWGTADQRPDAAPATLTPTLEIFLTSFFNNHIAGNKSKKHSASVLAQWAALHKRKATAYPLGDLVASSYTLGWLIGGGAWS